MRVGCVVRVESIGQDPTTSLWGKSCRRGCDLDIPHERYMWRVHVRVDGVLAIPSGGAFEAWGVGYPLEKISYLVPLRTGMS
jgi:hypothetical protein